MPNLSAEYNKLNQDGLIVLINVDTVVSGFYYFTNYGFQVTSNGTRYMPIGIKAKFMDSPDAAEPKASIEIDNVGSSFINLLTRTNFGVGTKWTFGQCRVNNPNDRRFIQPMVLKQGTLNGGTLSCEFDVGFSLLIPTFQMTYDNYYKPNLYQ